PMGKLKDRVDSASGAFAKLVNVPAVGSFRVSGSRRLSKDKTLRIVVCSPEQLAGTAIEQQRLLVSITDPSPVAKPELTPKANHPPAPLVLPFPDLAPANLQETWNEPIPPYDQTADQLIMTRELGKKLWSFLLRRRDPAPAVIVLQDDRLPRALSLAYATPP